MRGVVILLVAMLLGCTEMTTEEPAINASPTPPVYTTVEENTTEAASAPLPVHITDPLPASTLTPCRGAQLFEYDEGNVRDELPRASENERIMVARSGDGLDWDRMDRILMDAATTPDAVVDAHGRIYVYAKHYHYCEEDAEGFAVAVSDDRGWSWHYYWAEIDGLPSTMTQEQPDVIALPDGRFRMYFASSDLLETRPQCDDDEGRNVLACAKLYSAISEDGVHFSLEEGVRFELDRQHVTHPTVLHAQRYQLFSRSANGNYRAVSEDGISFIGASGYCWALAPGRCIRMANGLTVPEGYRFYGAEIDPLLGESLAVYSLFSRTGESWVVEDGYRLLFNQSRRLESDFIGDPAVAKASNYYWMFYSTAIPDNDPAVASDYARQAGG